MRVACCVSTGGGTETRITQHERSGSRNTQHAARTRGVEMAAKRPVTITVNGEMTTHEVEPRLLLVHYLRDVLGLTGTHIGCDTSQCGACTVHLDGEAVKSCTIFAVQANGRHVRTIEGMAQNGALHPLQ